MACSNTNSLFTQGSSVEVASDADGFRGVWYDAKILEPPSFTTPPTKRRRKKAPFFFVEYQTLLTDDGLKLLTEHVPSSFIRPLPPADDDRDPQVNDVVDAFHLDGWWVGVVLKVNEKSESYLVYFESPPELLEFNRSQLRFHWDWAGGKWVRPQKKEVLNGMEYELQYLYDCTDNPEQTVAHENCCVVEKNAVLMANYSTKNQIKRSFVSTEDSGGKELKQAGLSTDTTVSCPLMGLKTTVSTHISYQTTIHVDMMKQKEGGSGSLKRKRGERKKPSVKGKKCDGAVDTVDKCVSKDHAIIGVESPKSTGETKGAVGKMVLKDHATISCESSKSTGESKVKRHDGEGAVDQRVLKDHAIIGCESSGKNTRESKVKRHDGAGGAVNKMVLEDHVTIGCELSNNTVDSKGKKHDGAVGTIDKFVSKDHVIIGFESPENTGETKGKRHDGDGGAVDKMVLKDHVVIGYELSKNTRESKAVVTDKFVSKDHAIIFFESPKITGETRVENHDEDGGAFDIMVLKDHAIIGCESSGNTTESKGKKHDGAGGAVDEKVLKDQVVIDSKSPKNTGESRGAALINEEKHDGAGGAVDKMVLEDHVIIDVKSPKNTGDSRDATILVNGGLNSMVLVDHAITDAVSSINMGNSKDEELDGAGLAVDEMDVQDRANNEVESPQIRVESTVSEDVSAGKVARYSDTACSTREAEMAIVKIPGNRATIAKPKLMWSGRFCPQKIVVDSSFNRARTVNQWDEATGRVIEIVKDCTTNESVSDRMLDENGCFPCVEPSSIFKAIIESLEVFQTMPQKPHFHPLKKCKEMYREGLAIAYFVTFANVVKRTCRLQVNDPTSIFDSLSETLLDLELHGFDVKTIRNRLAELRLMKDRQEQLQQESKEFDRQIADCAHKQTKLVAELDKIDEEMKVLEEMKKRVMSLKEKTDSKLNELKLNFDVRNQDIQSVRIDFESLAAAPW